MKWSLNDVAQAVGGQLTGADVPLDGVSTDTRTVKPGQLFIALKGEKFDARDFLPQALAAGAAALLVQDAACLPGGANAVVVADDTRLALGRLAAAWRRRFSLPVLAVTGSNGKTTTKEMIAAILRGRFGDGVLSTQGNLNNEIGLPLTLLGLHEGHRAAVVELGMSHPGEIAHLVDIAAPTAALVTNAQRAHLEGMGDLTEVAREKGAIFSANPAAGTAVINADDAFAELWKQMAGERQILTYGVDRQADVHGAVIQHGLETRLILSAPVGGAEIALAVPGRHNARNAVAAAAICLATGLPMAAVTAGLAAFGGVKGRLQRRPGKGGAAILDDSYNANPDSVRAGIDVLASTIGRKILVLGDMGEIGLASAQCHDEIGGYAKSQGVDRLFALGDAARKAARNFGEGGAHFCHVDKLLLALLPELDAGTTVLVKGSRFMKMERVANAIADDGAALQPAGKDN